MLPKAGSSACSGIGPFEQRIQDYQDTQINTIVYDFAGLRERGRHCRLNLTRLIRPADRVMKPCCVAA
jgi:hypothetical protein